MLSKQTLKRADLVKILNGFSLGKILNIKALATSGNQAYVLRVASGLYLLRLCPLGPRWRSPGEIAAEIELLDYLKKQGLPVISAWPDKNGKRIVSRGRHYGYLRPYCAGRAKFKPSPGNLLSFGGMLGKMQSALKNFQTKKKRRHIFDPEETKKYFLSQKNKILKSNFKNKEKFISTLEQELSGLKFPATLPAGMIHEDLGRRHVLWQKNKIVSLIDFDRAYFSYLLLDLGQAVRGWCFKNNWRLFDRRAFHQLMSGYQNVRKLNALEKKYLPAAIKFAILERALSFCTRYLDYSHDPEDENFALASVFTQLPKIEKNRKFISSI